MNDVFISYSHKDAAIADAICHKFEEAGIRCWYAPRNIQPGQAWAAAIVEAIESTKLMVLIFTDFSNASKQVRREVDTAISAGKTIIPFKCSEQKPSGSMRYYLSSLHWIDALSNEMNKSIDSLLYYAKELLKKEEEKELRVSLQQQGIGAEQGSGDPKNKTKLIAFAASGVAMIAVIAIVAVLLILNKPTESVTEPSDAQTTASIAEQQNETTVTSYEKAAVVLVDSDLPPGGYDSPDAVPEEYNEADVDPNVADHYLYSKDKTNEHIILEKYIGPEVEKIVVPAKLDGLPVTEIAQKCFYGNKIVTTVLLPENITTLDNMSFDYCEKLKCINFPSTLKKYRHAAFSHTSFKYIVFPAYMEHIGTYELYGCKELENVVFMGAVDDLGEKTFHDCPKLSRVTIPSAELKIDVDAFDKKTDVTLIGVKGSYTEKYAVARGLKFEEIKP